MINLLPQKVREDRAYGRRNIILVGFIISFVVAAALVASVMFVSLQQVNSEENDVLVKIDSNQENIGVLKDETSEISVVATRLNSTFSLFDSSIKFSELIPSIGALLPEGTTINGLTLTGGTSDPLQLDVNLANASLAPVLQQNLINSDIFEAADVNSISPRSSIDGTYNFGASVTISFTGSAEAKRKAVAAEAAAAQAAAEINGEQESGDNQ